MDLLGDYGSDESSSSDDDEQLRKLANDRDQKGAQQPAEIVLSKDIPEDAFVRTVPHTEGNWTGHVFCTVPDTWQEAMNESIQRFQQYLGQKKSGFHGLQLISHLDCDIHMSLSRPFALQLSSVESFVQRLKRRLCHLPATTLRVNPCDERILVNDERTRSFWTWQIDSNPTLIAIVEETNAVLHEYNQPPYYHPPLFHVSFASVVGELCTNNTRVTSKFKPDKKLFALPVTQVHCSFGGTKTYSIDLLEQ